MKRRERPEFFLDRSLGKHIVADALRREEETVHIHDNHFAPDERDEVWLREVGRRGWVILSKDKAIRRRILERKALLAAEAVAFFLTSGNMTADEMGATFVRGPFRASGGYASASRRHSSPPSRGPAG